jgi:ribonucleoside-triphosphate reductase
MAESFLLIRKRLERDIYKAFQCSRRNHSNDSDELSQVVTNQLFEKFGTNTLYTLKFTGFSRGDSFQYGYSKVSKAYNLYRRKRHEAREALKPQ